MREILLGLALGSAAASNAQDLPSFTGCWEVHYSTFSTADSILITNRFQTWCIDSTGGVQALEVTELQPVGSMTGPMGPWVWLKVSGGAMELRNSGIFRITVIPPRYMGHEMQPAGIQLERSVDQPMVLPTDGTPSGPRIVQHYRLRKLQPGWEHDREFPLPYVKPGAK
jgi:hypothetical protein